MNQLLIFTKQQSNRLEYIANFLLTEVLGLKVSYTNNHEIFINSEQLKLNYSSQSFSACISISPNGLLFEDKIQTQVLEMSLWENLPCFFLTESVDIPFDLLSASFYLLSRYEEYLPHEKDEFKRYPAENSLAYKQQFLSIPLIDLWMIKFKNVLLKQYPAAEFNLKQFKFQPSYDIDIAYSYLGKGLFRNLGGAMRDLLHGELFKLLERTQVLLGGKKDPYDSYDFLDELHASHHLKPLYFILLSKKVSEFDKNLSPHNKYMQALLQRLQAKDEVLIHPSYQSNEDKNVLQQEIKLLGKAKSRQHYIRWELPSTYRNLLEAGIKADYSMGYGSVNGFRASTSHVHSWFDLEKNAKTELMIYPFCFMECTSYFEQGYSIEETKTELIHYFNMVKSVEGNLITIWHNFSLGTDTKWKGWPALYEWFVAYVQSS